MTAHEKNEKYSLLVRGRYRNKRGKGKNLGNELYLYIYILTYKSTIINNNNFPSVQQQFTKLIY